MRELLIVGVDPGTTVGYAVLDTRGNVLGTRSSKQLELNSIVEEVVGFGTVLVIGTDKKKCPGLIEKAAAKTGARIIAPKEDLFVAEKETLTRNYTAGKAGKAGKAGNEHEKDALAAAIYAYKELEPLLQRIRKVLEDGGKQHMFGKVAEIVVTEGINIKAALRKAELG